MKFDREHREAIRRYILKRIDNRQKNIAVTGWSPIQRRICYRFHRRMRCSFGGTSAPAENVHPADHHFTMILWMKEDMV